MREFIIFTMKDRNITQVELARVTGFSRQHISEYLKGNNDSVKLELAILEYLRNGDS